MRETPDASLAFERYYDLGEERTLVLLAQHMHQELLLKHQDDTKPIPTEATLLSRVKKWSAEHGWQERVIERDRAQAEKDRKRRNKDVQRMNEEHALLGRTQALRAVRHIEELMKANKFGSQAAVTLFKYASDLERVARGAATEVSQVQGTEGEPLFPSSSMISLDTRSMTAEQLRQLKALAMQMPRSEQ